MSSDFMAVRCRGHNASSLLPLGPLAVFACLVPEVCVETGVSLYLTEPARCQAEWPQSCHHRYPRPFPAFHSQMLTLRSCVYSYCVHSSNTRDGWFLNSQQVRSSKFKTGRWPFSGSHTAPLLCFFLSSSLCGPQITDFWDFTHDELSAFKNTLLPISMSPNFSKRLLFQEVCPDFPHMTPSQHLQLHCQVLSRQ